MVRRVAVIEVLIHGSLQGDVTVASRGFINGLLLSRVKVATTELEL